MSVASVVVAGNERMFSLYNIGKDYERRGFETYGEPSFEMPPCNLIVLSPTSKSFLCLQAEYYKEKQSSPLIILLLMC